MQAKWKSRSLLMIGILVLMMGAFLGTYIWLIRYVGGLVMKIVEQGKEVPSGLISLANTLPFGALVTGLGAAVTSFIAGNRGITIARNIPGARSENGVAPPPAASGGSP